MAELSSDTVTTTLVKYMVLLTSYFITDSSHQGYILKDITIIKAIQVLILLKPSLIQKYICSSFQSFVSFFFFLSQMEIVGLITMNYKQWLPIYIAL